MYIINSLPHHEPHNCPRSEGGSKQPCERSIIPLVDYQCIVSLRLLFLTRDSIASSCVLSCSSFELSGTAVTALWLKTRFFVRIIFMRDLQCGSGQLGRLLVSYAENPRRRFQAPVSTHAISASVVIQSFWCVVLCFAARSGSMAPGTQ
jgi:hypothetical protein